MDKYNITGMSCAACQAHVEKAVSKVPGVDSVSVSLLTNSMGVEGSEQGSWGGIGIRKFTYQLHGSRG